MENVNYSFVEGMLRLKLSSDAEYPVVLGFKGENSIGNLVNTKRELQPGESVYIDKDTGEQKELLKEDIFYVTYEDDSEETVNTSVDEDFDALLFCKSFRYQEDSLLQKFNVEETSGDIV